MNTDYIFIFLGQLFLVLVTAKLFTEVNIGWGIVFLPIWLPITLLLALIILSKIVNDKKNNTGS